METIREYQICPEKNVLENPLRSEWAWLSKKAVDLRWVSSASPGYAPDATSITLAGGGVNTAFDINIPYNDFMREWTASRST